MKLTVLSFGSHHQSRSEILTWVVLTFIFYCVVLLMSYLMQIEKLQLVNVRIVSHSQTPPLLILDGWPFDINRPRGGVWLHETNVRIGLYRWNMLS